MTEDDARKKWCPHVRLACGDGWTGSSNSDPQAPGNKGPLYCCIASDCMMWVATDNECEPQQHFGNATVPDPEPKCYPAGYCGLTNKP